MEDVRPRAGPHDSFEPVISRRSYIPSRLIEK
jgi:hypothetical protein